MKYSKALMNMTKALSFKRKSTLIFIFICFGIYMWISTPKTELIFRNYNTVSKCILPNFNPFDPTIMQFAQKPDPLSCSKSNNKVYVSDNGTLIFNTSVELQNIHCEYNELVRESDDINVHFKKGVPFFPPFVIPAEIFRVGCKNDHNKLLVDKLLSKILVNQTKIKTEILDESVDNYSILLFGLDSVSRLSTIRQLPQTYDFLTNTLGAHVFRGHTKIAENTLPNLLSLLTGKALPELPFNDQQFDKFPLILKNFSSSGYVTLYAEDWPFYNLFNYENKGFHMPPADHYFRPFWLGREKLKLVSALDPVFFFLEDKDIRLTSSSLCYDDKPKHVIQMEYLKNFMDTYKGKRKFAFSFLCEISHEYPRFLQLMDEDILDLLKHLVYSKDLENTILIFFSDHGSRNGDIRNTLIGKIEDNMPILSISLPKKLKKKYPHLSKIMQDNTHHLTTHFDIYETLKDILDGNYQKRSPPEEPLPRGISLMQSIPNTRSCKDAHVLEHYCSCDVETPVDVKSSEIETIGEKIVEKLNEILFKRRDMCTILHLSKVLACRQILSGMKVVGEKKEGVFSFLKGITRPKNDIKQYVIIVETLPSNATFESFVKMIPNKGIEISGEISRTNRYDNQSACVAHDIVRRQYCFCKN